MPKAVGGILLALLVLGAVLIEQKRINNETTAKRGSLLHKVNLVADQLIQSCGRPQHESAMSSLSPQLTYDNYHLMITVAFSSNPIFIDTETDNQIGRDAAIHTMPCLEHWLSQQSAARAQEPSRIK
jgi:hypothetical protein